MVGCMVVIVLEFLVVYRCFQTARVAKSSMDALICVGFGTMLIFQTVENIGMCLFVMPVIGLTLPFSATAAVPSCPSSPPWASAPAAGAGLCRTGCG